LPEIDVIFSDEESCAKKIINVASGVIKPNDFFKFPDEWKIKNHTYVKIYCKEPGVYVDHNKGKYND
jgi:hypothetical protein